MTFIFFSHQLSSTCYISVAVDAQSRTHHETCKSGLSKNMASGRKWYLSGVPHSCAWDRRITAFGLEPRPLERTRFFNVSLWTAQHTICYGVLQSPKIQHTFHNLFILQFVLPPVTSVPHNQRQPALRHRETLVLAQVWHGGLVGAFLQRQWALTSWKLGFWILIVK